MAQSDPVRPVGVPRRGLSRRLLGDLPREVAVLVAVAFCVALGFGIVVPAIPVFAKTYDVSNLAASSVISVFAFMRLVSALWSGRLVDRVGERLVLVVGILVVAVSSLFAGLSQSFVQLLLLRGVGGVGSAMFTVAATSLLLRVVVPEQRAQAQGAFQSGFLIGGITGPLFGGPLTEWSVRAPFFVYAGTLGVAALVGGVFLAHSTLREKDTGEGVVREPMPLKEAVRSTAYQGALASNFANGWALFGVRSALVPLFVTEAMMVQQRWVGYGIFVGAVVQGLALVPAGRASDRRGRRPPLLLGSVLAVGGGLLLALGGSLGVYLLAMAVYGAGSALIGTSSAAVVGDVIHGRGGRPVAAYGMASDAGALIGPLVAGALSDSFGFTTAFVVTALVSALSFLAVLRMPETRGSSPPTFPIPPGSDPGERSGRSGEGAGG